MSIYRSDATIVRPAPLGGGSWTLRRLGDVTVRMGKNGSGKSLLVGSWRDQAPEGVHYVVPERTGEMEFHPQFIQEEFDGAGRRSSATRNFVPEYRRRVVSRIQAYFMVRGNTRGDGPAPVNPSELERL